MLRSSAGRLEIGPASSIGARTRVILAPVRVPDAEPRTAVVGDRPRLEFNNIRTGDIAIGAGHQCLSSQFAAIAPTDQTVDASSTGRLGRGSIVVTTVVQRDDTPYVTVASTPAQSGSCGPPAKVHP